MVVSVTCCTGDHVDQVERAQRIVRKLDYGEEGFVDSEYEAALAEMAGAAITVLTQPPGGGEAEEGQADPWSSFIPLNCVL
eukprot:COSAG06_NODE_13065_length_1297_cov_1.411519_2_plen_81_part_00